MFVLIHLGEEAGELTIDVSGTDAEVFDVTSPDPDGRYAHRGLTRLRNGKLHYRASAMSVATFSARP